MKAFGAAAAALAWVCLSRVEAQQEVVEWSRLVTDNIVSSKLDSNVSR